MERLREAVLRHARSQPEGVPLTAKGLLHLGSRAAPPPPPTAKARTLPGERGKPRAPPTAGSQPNQRARRPESRPSSSMRTTRLGSSEFQLHITRLRSPATVPAAKLRTRMPA